MKLAGKTVVLTGAGSGIGQALARAIVAAGGRVIGLDIRAEGMAVTGEGLGSAFTAHRFDVTDKAAVAALPGELGPVDCLINCAGMIHPFVRFGELSDETIERILQVNFFGTLAMCRAFLPHLLARPEAQLVNFGSMSSLAPLPGQSIYGVSKAAIKLLTESLYAEYLGSNLSVTLVLPGAVATAITANSGVSAPSASAGDSAKRPRDVASAEDAAEAILAGIEADAFRILVDKMVVDVDALYRADPQQAVETIARNFGGLLGD
jgi:NADP-dependent 3-hydroxy acid dehydrogenase YdfG